MTVVLAASARVEIADYLSALFGIYTLVVIAWIVLQLVFSLGVSVPYSRPVNAILDFLRDTADPYLRIFRRLGLRVGPFDLSPIVAILVLQVTSSIVVGIIAPG
ncbi:MAG: YggT family protein [Solirubrobacteraceae bacterium]